MDSMEKKRLLSALTAMALMLAAAGAGVSAAREPGSLEGVRTEPGEKHVREAKELLRRLREPDLGEAEKTLPKMRENSRKKRQREKAAKFFSVKARSLPASAEGGGVREEGKPGLLYFFSFSMPAPSLREAARETGAAGGVMVLRGLVGESLGKTALRISEVTGKTGVEVWIEPFLFECFSVEAVPQLILLYGPPAQTDCERSRYLRISGDVSLPRALGLMKKEDENAGAFIRRLEEQGFHGD